MTSRDGGSVNGTLADWVQAGVAVLTLLTVVATFLADRSQRRADEVSRRRERRRSVGASVRAAVILMDGGLSPGSLDQPVQVLNSVNLSELPHEAAAALVQLRALAETSRERLRLAALRHDAREATLTVSGIHDGRKAQALLAEIEAALS